MCVLCVCVWGSVCVCVCVQSTYAKVKTEFNKYMVKQKRELKSRFVTQQEKKKGSSRLRLLKSKSGQEVKIFHRKFYLLPRF